MLIMRLQRIGKRGQAYFRIVVTEHTKKPQGEYLELLGSYDPHKKDLKIKKERVEHWISKGVQLSPTVNNLFVNNKIIATAKKLSWKPKVVTKPVAAAAAPKAKADSDSAPQAESAPVPVTEAASEVPVEAPAEAPKEETLPTTE